MKRIIIIGTAIIVLIAAYSYTKGMMGQEMMDSAMKGRGMMSDDLKEWFNGEEVVINFAQDRPEENDTTIAAGQSIYQQRCTTCHGDKGDGNGPNSEYLITKPTDFTSGLYKFRSTPSGSIPTDEDLYTTISRGIRGTSMLPWFDLSDKEKWYVTYYIKTFSDRFEEEEPDSPVMVSKTTIENNELVNKGRYIYEQAKCWECHGHEGRGDGPKADELRDDWERSVRVKDFTGEPLKRGASTSDIYITVATGMDGTPMASYSNNITPDNMIALSSYIKSLADKQQPRDLGRMAMSQDERIGMMTYHHGGPGSMMHGRMMGD
jgi:cytochrome c oxidase cbb3-type subunit 2